MKRKSFKNLKKELLKNKEVKEHYDALGPEFQLIRMIIEKRNKEGLTQKDLAKKIGTKQSAISRFESGRYNPSIDFLKKLAKALDSSLKITLE